MNKFFSCMYRGEVVHQRYSPRKHSLRYRAFQVLIDLDELPRLNDELRLFSHNRPNLFAFYESDHGDGRAGTLRTYVDRLLTQAGRPTEGGQILLQCMPRIFGYTFNPLSIYYCFDADKELRVLIYEVSNTFGERHTYVIPVNDTGDEVIAQSCKKEFYVSPFMDMDMLYEFEIARPARACAVRIRGKAQVDGAPLILASFSGERREFSDLAIWSTLVSYPLLTLGVVGAIHWEAARLFAKGLRLRRRPPPPAAPVSFAETTGAIGEARIGIHKMDKQSA